MTKKSFHESFEDIEYLICDSAMLWRKLLNHKTRQLNITAHERRVLFVIKRHPGLTQVQVARYVDLKPQNLMRVLDRLEKWGWIIKKSAPEDRRSKLLYVTAKAQPIINAVNKFGAEIKSDVFSHLEKNQLKVLQDLLNQTKSKLLDCLD